MNPWASLIDPPTTLPGGDSAHGVRVAFRSCTRSNGSHLSDRCTCAVKLLRHGPLCWNDFVAITGWDASAAATVLRDLRSAGMVYRALGEWRLAA